MMRIAILGLVAVCAARSADQATLDRGMKEEQRQCLACHSLRIIHSQRLSRAAWTRELDKMAGWGTKYTDRDALLEYLATSSSGDERRWPGEEVAATDGRASLACAGR